MVEAANSNGCGISRFSTSKACGKMKGTVKNVNKPAPDVFTEAFPAIPRSAHSKLVVKSL
jgi:hypothetical protein